MDSLETVYHHGSHTHLLSEIDAASVTRARLDAVIVPTARPVGCLRAAMGLARAAGCPVIALCSRSARAADVAELGDQMGTATIPIDVGGAGAPMPAFATDAYLSGTRFASRSDLSLKRNLGLLLARVAGLSSVLFLDDDISGGEPADVEAAAGLLGEFHAVGLKNVGYPDNSVACHAYRAVGGEQETFVGGGAMVVAPGATRSFFPNVYNEDWFFLLGAPPPRRVAVTGRVVQKEYNPYADPARARAEEFGDSVAEGLYWLLDDGQAVEKADPAFWPDFLSRRRRFLATVLESARAMGQPAAMIASLEAARAISWFITPTLCREYVLAWRADLDRWGRHLDRFPRGLSMEKALAELGLGHTRPPAAAPPRQATARPARPGYGKTRVPEPPAAVTFRR